MTFKLLAFFNDVRLFTTPVFPRQQRKRGCGEQGLVLEEKAARAAVLRTQRVKSRSCKERITGAGRTLAD